MDRGTPRRPQPRPAAEDLPHDHPVGLGTTAIADSWLGVLTGDWWAEAGVLSLAALAVGATVTGCAALPGGEGVGLGALLIVFFGNPFSGAATAPQMLPEPVGVLGQWLPPGAGATLLRSVSYFDGAATLTPALVLPPGPRSV